MGKPWRRHAVGDRFADRDDGYRLAVARPSPRAFSAIRLLTLTVVSISVAFWLAAPQYSHAEPAPVEYEVKSAFVFNFGALVEWPKSTFAADSTEMVFCIAATEEVAAIFEADSRERFARTHPVVVRRVSSPAEMLGCHIAFITATFESPSQALLDAALGLPILTVGEADRFAHDGGIISFFAKGTKIRFEINQQVAENAELRISSRLLRLARIVSSESE